MSTLRLLAAPGLLLAVSSLLLAPPAGATVENQKAFKEYVKKVSEPSVVPLGKCTTCHVKPLPKKDDHAHNPYGAALANTIAGKKGATPDFAAVEGLDSDADGVKNLDEIRKGTNPGDPKSK